MDIRDNLIASPTNVKFQAPFPHNQKRQINLLNVGKTDLSYRIELEEGELFQVTPAKGEVSAFDTNELSIYMKPATDELKSCVLKVNYKANAKDSSKEEEQSSDQSERTVDEALEQTAEDWSDCFTTQVQITLENCVENEHEMRRMFELDGDARNITKVMEEKYKPICTNCCLKRTNPKILANKTSWKRLIFWPVCVTAVSFAKIHN